MTSLSAKEAYQRGALISDSKITETPTRLHRNSMRALPFDVVPPMRRATYITMHTAIRLNSALVYRAPGAAVKVAIARRLRQETTMSLKRIARPASPAKMS